MFINTAPLLWCADILCADTNINFKSREGNTPLHVAVIREVTIRVVIMLLQNDPSCVGIANNEGNTPLDIVVRNRRLYFVNMMVQKCSKEDISKAFQCSPCLLQCTISANILVLFLIIIHLKGFNINEVNHGGQTALHVACTSKNMKYIQVLIRWPTCDVNMKDNNGDTALHIAVCSKWNSAEKIQLILGSGRCEPNITNRQGCTPLHVATVNRDFNPQKYSEKCMEHTIYSY